MSDKKRYCLGCINSDYNGCLAKECRSLKEAIVAKRWKIGWWTSPITPGAFVEVETLDCHHAPGRYALYDKLPNNSVDPIRLKQEEAMSGVCHVCDGTVQDYEAICDHCVAEKVREERKRILALIRTEIEEASSFGLGINESLIWRLESIAHEIDHPGSAQKKEQQK